MQTFILAALAGVVSSQQLDNAQSMLDAPIVFTNGATATFSTLEEVVTGWTKNGDGKDASYDMKLWMRFSGRFTMNNA